MATRIFLSYSRGDDEAFVQRLHGDLTAAGLAVWMDRESLLSRGLTFHQEIKDAIRTEIDRLIYVGGPKAALSKYVREEWQFAIECDHVVVTPILRQGGFDSVPSELKGLHCEDFRNDTKYPNALARLVESLRQPNPELGALCAVPNLPPNFLARPELMGRVRDALRVDLQKPQVITAADARVGMQGMGGIGKSVLAAALARDRDIRRSYPDGIIWIACGQRPSDDDLVRRQQDLARHLGCDSQILSVPQGQAVLREWLAAKAVLVILDDVWRASDAKPFDVLGPRCRMLVTTRDAGVLHSLNGERVPVSLFTETEAQQLLADAVQMAPENLPPEAGEIVKECGSLPLAIALSGGMAKRQGGNFWSVLERLRRADLHKIADRESINEQHQSIWRAMQASVEMLPENEQARFAELSVFFYDRNVPEAAAATLWAHTGNFDELDSEELLINLSERSLIQLDQAAGADGRPHRRFRLHDLLYDYATRIAADRAALNRKLLDAYRAICAGGWPTGPNDGYYFEHLCQHLIALEDWKELIGDATKPGVLTDLLFIEAKCTVGLVYDLLRDYNSMLWVMPEFRDERDRLNRRDEATVRFNRALGEYAFRRVDWRDRKARGEAVPEPTYPLLPAELRADAEMEIPEESSGRAARLRQFANFVNGNLGSLNSRPCDILPLAFNEADDGPVATFAETQIGRRAAPWLRRSPRPPPPPLRPQCLRILEGHRERVSSLGVSPNGPCIVSGSYDKTLRVWDVATGACQRTLRLDRNRHVPWSISVAADGRRAVSVGGGDSALRVWDLETGICLRALEGHDKAATSVCICPDGRRAVSGRYHYGMRGGDLTVRVWDLETGACLRILEGHAEGIESICVSPDGRLAVSASKDKTLRVWDLETGALLRALEGHSDSVISVCVTPDGRLAVSASRDETLRVWDLETGACLRTLGGHRIGFSRVCVTPDARRAVSGTTSGTLLVWDLNVGKCLHTIEGHSGPIASVCISPNGRHAFSADGTVLRVWDLDGGERQSTSQGKIGRIDTIGVSPDGRLAISGSKGSAFRIWGLETGVCLRLLECGSTSTTSVCVNSDGLGAISGSADGSVRLWDMETGICRSVLGNHSCQVRSVLVTPNGRHALSGDAEGTLRVWDLETATGVLTLVNTRLPRVHGASVYCVGVTPDGCRAVARSLEWLFQWDLHNGMVTRAVEHRKSVVTSACVSLDGRRAIAGDAIGSLRIWDLKTGSCLLTLWGHSSEVECVCLSPDEFHVVSGSSDKTLRVWDLKTAACIYVYKAEAAICSAAWFLPGNRIVCGTSAGQMHFLTPVNLPPSGPAILTAENPQSARCPQCAREFSPPSEIVSSIRTGISFLRPEQSPCMELSESAFADPLLLTTCPHCATPIRFNPFFASSSNLGKNERGEVTLSGRDQLPRIDHERAV